MAAPVLFLIFNRPDTTALVMEAIRAARPPRLYIAADGPRDLLGEVERCERARRIATAVDWPCHTEVLFRDHNLGCRAAVSGAITWFFEHEPEGIILEDDCLPSAGFFPFCAELLERFRADTRIMAICGSCYADSGPLYPASYYFSYYADPWGWATWRRAWLHYDRDLSRWPEFKFGGRLGALSGGRKWHESYWAEVFDATREGRIDTWDYQWIYSVIEQNGLACYPTRNLITNLGFRPDATHTVAAWAGQSFDPAANLPHQELRSPLVHPTHFSRSAALDQQIEARRLKLQPPMVEGGFWVGRLRRLVKDVARQFKSPVRWLLGATRVGMIDYYRHPERGVAWGGPFNNQECRQRTFEAIIARFQPVAIVETGTYLGTTADFMAGTGVSVYTIEADPRNYGFARARLRKRNVTIRHGDSRAELRALFDGPLRSARDQVIFAYLDAHCNVDLPLVDELEIVFSRCPAAIAMIDDFQVPFDAGYGYDDYGPGNALTPSYVAPAVAAHDLQLFYPSTPSQEEGGARRGCVVLAKSAIHGSKLASMPLLRHGVPLNPDFTEFDFAS